MAKTATEVQTDIIALLEGSDLAKGVSGNIYRADPGSSDRPRDSRKEDIEVIHTSGIPTQRQTGVVTLRIWVEDIDPYGDGVKMKDGARAAQIEALAERWAEGLTEAEPNPGYFFSLQQTVCTEAEPDIAQHFVAVRLSYIVYDL